MVTHKKKQLIHQTNEQQAKCDLINQTKRIMKITKRRRFYLFLTLTAVIWFGIVPLTNYALTGHIHWDMWGTYKGVRVSILPYHTSKELYVFASMGYVLMLFTPIILFVHAIRRRTQLETDDARYLLKTLYASGVEHIPIVVDVKHKKDRLVNIHYVSIREPLTIYQVTGRSGYYEDYFGGYRRIITSKNGKISDLTHITYALLMVLPTVTIKNIPVDELIKSNQHTQ